MRRRRRYVVEVYDADEARMMRKPFYRIVAAVGLFGTALAYAALALLVLILLVALVVGVVIA